MHLHIDIKYLNIIGTKLDRFKKTKDDTWNCRCPFCGDSQKSTRKARGYFYKGRKPFSSPNELIFKCHNCSVSMKLGTFLKEQDSQLFDEYVLERYKNGASGRDSYKEPKFEKELNNTPFKLEKISLPSIAELSDEHFAKEYIQKRQVDEKYWDRIFFTENFAKWVNEVIPSGKYANLKTGESRIILPFFDRRGRLLGGQGRSLESNERGIRYVTFRKEETDRLLFGLERWKKNKPTFLVEGPFDSLFLPNGLASSNPDLYSLFMYLKKIATFRPKNVCLIYDNEPRNREILSLMGKAIDMRMKVMLWPETIREKDINELVVSKGYTTKELLDLINKNTFSGLEAKVRFNNWKRK